MSSKRTNKKKSMQRTKPVVESSVSNKPHKNVSINITLEGDNQALDNNLSQTQDIKYQQPIPKPDVVQEKPDEGLKEQLADAIRRLDEANDMATRQGIRLPNRLQSIPQNILDVKNSQDIRTLISYIVNMINQIFKLIGVKPTPTPIPAGVKPTPTPIPTAVKPTPTPIPSAVKPTPTPIPSAVKPPPIPAGVKQPPPPYQKQDPFPPPDYERKGDTLRDITVRNAQLALQRGDLPVLQKALKEVIQAQSTLSQYIVLEPRDDYDALIKAQILDLDTYKNQLEIAIKKAKTPPVPPPVPSGKVTPPPEEKEEKVYKNEYGKFIDFKINKLMNLLASKPVTNRAQSINADRVIQTRINSAVKNLNLALEKPDLTTDEFDTVMKPLPIEIIGSWAPNRALIILKGESIIPGLNDVVELREVQTPEGSQQLYKLFFNGTELTSGFTEVFFTENGELFTQEDIQPVQQQPVQQQPVTSGDPFVEVSDERRNKLLSYRNSLYKVGRTDIDTAIDTLNNEIENALSDGNAYTTMDLTNGEVPLAVATKISTDTNPRDISGVYFEILSPESMPGGADPAYNLYIDNQIQNQPNTMTRRLYNRFGGNYQAGDMEGFNPVISYPFIPSSSTDELSRQPPIQMEIIGGNRDRGGFAGFLDKIFGIPIP